MSGRTDKKLVDEDALKEVVYNAVAHNDWASGQVPAVYKFDDRFEIISHGGLPIGQTEEEFYAGVSKPRNAALMRVMCDLNLAESTGHGVPNIVRVYGRKAFRITSSYISVTLPFDEEVLRSLDMTSSTNNSTNNSTNSSTIKLSATEAEILGLMKKDSRITNKLLAEKLGKELSTIKKAIKKLQISGLIRRVGSNRSGYWEIVEE